MSVLMWEKPKQIISKEEWKGNQADSAPPGTFMPNMSREDSMRWKAKIVGATLGFPQVELRRNGMVVILSKKGYKYNGYDFRGTPERIKKADRKQRVVHIASSGAQCFSLEEYEEFQQALKEGWEALEAL